MQANAARQPSKFNKLLAVILLLAIVYGFFWTVSYGVVYLLDVAHRFAEAVAQHHAAAALSMTLGQGLHTTSPQNASTGLYGAPWTGTFDLVADTTPSALGPLAAPHGCTSPGSYRSEIRNRLRTDHAVRQQLAVMARRLDNSQHNRALEIRGPFTREAREILQAIATRRAAA